MIKAFALLAIACGCLFVYGFLAADTAIRITTLKETKTTPFTVVVTVPNVTDQYRWIALYGCTAQSDDNSAVSCDGFWEVQSSREMRADQAQYPFPMRSVPKTMLQWTAMAFDANQKTLARGQTVVLR